MLLTTHQTLEAVREIAVQSTTPCLRDDESLGRAVQNIAGNLARVLASSNPTVQYYHDMITGDDWKDHRDGMILEVLNAIVEETLSQIDDWVNADGIEFTSEIREILTSR